MIIVLHVKVWFLTRLYQLPVNQWQLEIENLSNVGLATFQLIGVQAVSPPALQLDSNTTYDMYITAPNNYRRQESLQFAKDPLQWAVLV